MALAMPKDDWTPDRLKDHRAWRKKMYGGSVKKIPVRHLEAKISPPTPQPVERREIAVTVHFGYPMLPVNEYKTFKFTIIKKACCAAAGIGMSDLVSQARQSKLVKARMIAIMLCRMFGGSEVSMPIIGRAFGGRDHTTILHALRKTKDVREAVERRVNPDAPLNEFVAAAFDAWDELVQPIHDANQRKWRENALAMPRNGTKWAAK